MSRWRLMGAALLVVVIGMIGLRQKANAQEAYLCSEGGLGASSCMIGDILSDNWCQISCPANTYACCYNYTGDEPGCRCIR